MSETSEFISEMMYKANSAVTAVKIEVGVENKPANSDIKYYVSTDEGSTWQEVALGIMTAIAGLNTTLHYKIVFSNTDNIANPKIEGPITVSYEVSG